MALIDLYHRAKKKAEEVLNSPAPKWAARIPDPVKTLKPVHDFMAGLNTRPLSSRADSMLGKVAGGIVETPYTFLTSVPKFYGSTVNEINSGGYKTRSGQKRILGHGIETALDTASMGVLGKGKALLTGGVKDVASRKFGDLTKRIVTGARKGAAVGGGYGGGYGASEAFKQDKSAIDTVKDTGMGAAMGTVFGGALGGGLPAAGGLTKAVRERMTNPTSKRIRVNSAPTPDIVSTKPESFRYGRSGYRMDGNIDTVKNQPIVRPTLSAIGDALPRPGMSIEDVSGGYSKSKAKKLFGDGIVRTDDSFGNLFYQIKGKAPEGISGKKNEWKKGFSLGTMAKQSVTPAKPTNVGIWDFDKKTKLLRFDNGSIVQKDFVDDILKRYPGAMPFVDGTFPDGVVAFRISDDVVGVVRPIHKATMSNVKSLVDDVIPARKDPVSTPRQTEGMPARPGIRKTPQTEAGESSTQPPISSRPYKEINPFESYSAQGQKATPTATKLRTIFQDRMAVQKKLQQRPGVKVSDDANPYQAEELFHGRAGSRVEEANREMEGVFQGMADYAKETGLDFKQLRGAVNRYLQARHTPERNALHGDGASGMLNIEADDVMRKISESGHGDSVARFADELSAINKKTLDILQDAGILSQEQVETMRKSYQNHVPLNRIMDDGEDIIGVLGGGKGFDVKSSGVKKATGSDREVNDIAGNILANYEQAIIRAEKNKYGQNVLRFAENNKDLGLFEVVKDGTPDKNTLVVFRNGEKVNLNIKDDALAAALKGVDVERIPELLRPVAAVTRFFSAMATRYNPEFVLSNIVRDSQELAVYIAAQGDLPKNSVSSVTKMIPGSALDVRRALTGDFSSEGSKLYRQMVADGGTTGGLGLSSRKQVQLDVTKLEKLVNSRSRQAGRYLADTIDNWNQIFEDATRLSAYKQAIASGLSRERAASIAKNATVNFNRKGTSGTVINSLYMFANASIQGSAKMLIAMKNPKVAAGTVAAVAVPVFAINEWNNRVDPEWRNKVADWDRQSNLVVMLPSNDGSAKYMTVPVSWGLKPIKVIADQTYDIATGNASDKYDIIGKIVTAFTESYNPVGGTDLVSAAVPTVLDAPVDIARNKKWTGSMIRSDKELVSNHENYFQSLGNTPLGSAMISATDKVAEATGNRIDMNPANLTYALQQLIGGAGRSAERFITMATAPFRESDLEAKDVPFVNRFYKDVPAEEIEKSAKYKERDSFEKNLKKLDNGSDQQKSYIQEYLWSKPKGDRQGIMYGLQMKGVSTKGLTVKDREEYESGVKNKPYEDAIKESKATLGGHKKLGDIGAWLNEAENLYSQYGKMLEGGSLSEAERLTIQGDMKVLEEQFAKYQGYGGFTKPKSGGSSKASKAAKYSSPTDSPSFIVSQLNTKFGLKSKPRNIRLPGLPTAVRQNKVSRVQRKRRFI